MAIVLYLDEVLAVRVTRSESLKKVGEKMNELIESWENELDSLGTNSETEKYIVMLAKAPAGAPSLPTLKNFVEMRVSA
jgi:hypothetical protein